jgi:hypothetical protein
MLNKKTLTVFLIANSLYILYFILLMIWLKAPIITDVSRQPVILSNSVLGIIQIVMSVLSLVVYIGLAWILRHYHEKTWVVISVWIYLVLQLYFNMLSVLNIYRVPLPYLFYNYTAYINYAVLLFMIVSLLFVKNVVIRGYYRWFAITTFIAMLLVRFTPVLYDKYGLKWALINPGLLKLIPFVISLFLFITLSKLTNKQIASTKK